MNTCAKMMITTLPPVFFFLFATMGATYYLSYTALTDLAETWLETRVAKAVEIVSAQNDMLRVSGLEEIPASIAKAKQDAGALMAAIEVGARGYVFAVDRRGEIVMHPDPDMMGGDVSEKQWFLTMAHKKGQVAYDNPEGKHLALYNYFEPWQWFILAADPEDEVYGAAGRMKPYLLSLAIVCAIVMTTVLMLLARRLTAPLRALTAGADRVGRGDLTTRIEIRNRDEFGRLAAVFNQMSDKVRETLTRLEHREEYFRALIENSTDIVTILAADGAVLYASPSIERTLAYTPADLFGKIVFDFIHPQDIERVRQMFKNHVGHSRAVLSGALRFQHKSGAYRILEATSKNLLQHPSIRGIVVYARDISKRKRTDKALQNAYLALEQRVSERTAELAAINRRLCKKAEKHTHAATVLKTN